MELREYHRAELEEIFKTSRTDSITRSLKRAGYTYTTSGRCENYTITITALPEPPAPFEVFVKREFNCGPQTNFKAMQTHLFLLFYHPDYQFLPSNHQAKFLLDNYGIKVSDQSLRNWQNLLIDKNWIAKDKEHVKYVLCRKGESPREITRDEYIKAWQRYFALIADKVPRSTALHIIYTECGGMPRKQYGIAENALQQEKLQELRNILENIY